MLTACCISNKFLKIVIATAQPKHPVIDLRDVTPDHGDVASPFSVFGRTQGRVAELRVLLDACGRDGLGDHNTTSLEAPPDHHLRRRQATPSRDVEQALVLELLGPRERRVGLHENTLGRAELAKRRACDEGVAFYL